MTVHYYAFETSTKPDDIAWLVESWERSGISGKFIGRGETWQGFDWKLRYLSDFFNTVDLPDDDIIVLTDARDVLYFMANARSPGHNEFETILNQSGFKMMFGAEAYYGDPPFRSESLHHYCSLNSGVCFGYVSKFRDVWQRAVEALDSAIAEGFDSSSVTKHAKWVGNDQYWLWKVCDQDPEVMIDRSCEVIQNMWDDKWGKAVNFDLIYDYVGHTITNQRFDTNPIIFHSPGTLGRNGLSQVYKILTGKY